MHIKNNPKDSVNLFALPNSCCNSVELVFEVTAKVRHKSLTSQNNKVWAEFDIRLQTCTSFACHKGSKKRERAPDL